LHYKITVYTSLLEHNLYYVTPDHVCLMFCFPNLLPLQYSPR